MSSQKGTPSAPYTPGAAAASERMLSSVLGRTLGTQLSPIGRALSFADRVVGGIVQDAEPATERRGAMQRLFPQPVFGPAGAPAQSEAATASESGSDASVGTRRVAPTQVLAIPSAASSESRRNPADLRLPAALRPAMTLSSSERMFGSAAGDARDASAIASPGPLLSAAWDAPALSRAALSTTQTSDAAPGPLWNRLPKLDLAPVIAAVEADLGVRSSSPAAAATSAGPGEQARERPRMTLLRDGDEAASRPQSDGKAYQAAMDASNKLIDALRAHAAAHSSANDDRISLGDLTLIAHADSKQQMAAATSHASNAPKLQQIESPLGQLAHPKVVEDRKALHNKMKACAKLVMEDLEKAQKLAKERFGAYG